MKTKIKQPQYQTSRPVTREINNLGLAVPEITESNIVLFEIEYLLFGRIEKALKHIFNWNSPNDIFIN